MKAIKKESRYLKRLTASLRQKIIIVRYIPKNTKLILDVGCADGAVTLEIARMFPKAKVLGIDLNRHFIQRAQQKHGKKASEMSNLSASI